ncbi:MAG: helix-turn-helix domain-containing protein [Clostridiales bacterium]|nr:helix-turn-helix domain-containing protein [Clostridiales bacterium]
MTPNYISRLFKLETGLNIVQYINYMKLERAKDMLANTTDSIKLVSLHLGFDEPSYFNFNKTYGMNPTEYRKLLQQYGYTSAASAEMPRNPA